VNGDRAGPLFFLLGLITVFTIWLAVAVLTEDAPPTASPQPQGAAQGWALEEELPVARPRAGGSSVWQSTLDQVVAGSNPVPPHLTEPARPPFVWDYQLGPGLHGPPITRAEAQRHLYNACQGPGCGWWVGVMVEI